MRWLRDLSVRYKLFLVAVVAGGGFGLFVLLNYLVAHDNALRLDRVGKVYFPVLELADRNLVDLDKIKELLTSAVISGEPELLEKADAKAAGTRKRFQSIARLDQAMAAEVQAMLALFDDYYAKAGGFTRGMLDGSIDMTSMQSATAAMAAALEKYAKRLRAFRENRYAEFNGELETSKSASDRLVIIGLLIGAVIVSLVSLSLYVVSTLISSNLTRIVASLHELARGRGDLTRRLQTNTHDETGQVVFGFNEFLDKLHGLIKDVVLATEQLGANAAQLSMVTETTEDGVNRQKIETEQLMTAMTEMVATVNEVARNAAEAAAAASEANTETTAGLQVLEEAVSVIRQLESRIESASGVINDLRQRSDDIGGVLDVICGIAEQTNLLALNAAIEAARAGEQGRGFAVVADEVRTLAGRTQASTAEIQAMIESLQQGAGAAVEVMEQSNLQARDSVTCIGRVSESLATIADSVGRIHGMSEEISTATEEQSAVASEMNENIVNISDISAQTSMSAQITTTTSNELSELANNLVTLVGTFKVK